MQSAARIAVSVFLLSSALVSASHNGAKLRRDGILNLYPFPRVGRSHHTWQVPLNDFILGEYEPEAKRQLYAFPRVGRSESSMIHPEPFRADQQQSVAIRRTDSPGMWFGPRLGRAFKSDEDDITIQNENERSEPEQIELDHVERSKRQIKLL
ncbi:CAPA peptides-like [Hyposmocoma kahamanoa]|uniref:CAPA peptides-like n=1 Tax=Hyposmocoma kahamanoa TaxID=1477025 RepID=UPI000E6D7FC3|nr:CAPA peptides-like [Hyposmocoma kahamanoa]